MSRGLPIPVAFCERPLAHRGLHDSTDGRPENSRAAVCAAIEKGYGVEIDVQLSADGHAMVFHDYDLGRLTADSGPVRARQATELENIGLKHSDEGIPTLEEILGLVDGQGPVLIEIKDQDGALGPNVGPLEEAVAVAMQRYAGEVAVMSFNPHSVAAMADLAPSIPRGLTTCGFAAVDWPVSEARLAELRGIPDFDRVGASFISHDHADLDRPRVAELKADGAMLLCWTIRSLQDEVRARRIVHNVTFEGYPAGLLH